MRNRNLVVHHARARHAALEQLDGEGRLREWAERVRTCDYFTILGVDPSAPIEAIAEAHRVLKAQIRPDDFVRNPTLLSLAREVLQGFDEAWDVLSVPELRAAYAQHLRPGDR